MSANLKVKEPDIMKSLFAFGLPVAILMAAGTPAFGQVGSQHALGGSIAAAAQSRPLGGISRGGASGGRRSGTGRAPGYAYPYAYSFYSPGYFDDYDYGYGNQDYSYPAVPPPPPPQQAAPAAPPVIINQFFGTPPPQYQGPPPAQGAAAPASDQSSAPSDHHYLLAYKNHTVYEVLAYWVEDKTMNYVTAGNKHNQASLDLIDMDLTKTLNEGR
jgi:hypothetical protein